jgi:3-oxoacyl-[acyl-carrier-protein] synthase II
MSTRYIISGVGMIGDFGVGKEDFFNFLSIKKDISNLCFDDYVDTSLLRRADELSYCATIAAKLALQDANIDYGQSNNGRLGIVLGTTHGSLAYTLDYHRELVLAGPATVSPMLFSNSVLNASSGYVSSVLNIQGPAMSISGYTPVFQATQCAIDLMQQDVLDYCLVGGVDIYNEIIIDGYSKCIANIDKLKCRHGGSGFFVVESLASARNRNISGYAEIHNITTLHMGIQDDEKNSMIKYQGLLGDVSNYDLDCIMKSFVGGGINNKVKMLFSKNMKTGNEVDCTKIFGYTFSASEVFQIILGAMALKGFDGVHKLGINIKGKLNTLMLAKSFKTSLSCGVMGKIEST